MSIAFEFRPVLQPLEHIFDFRECSHAWDSHSPLGAVEDFSPDPSKFCQSGLRKPQALAALNDISGDGGIGKRQRGAIAFRVGGG